MGMSASEIASLLLLLGCVQLPCMILGGKLADRFPKRNIIIVCDLVTVASYMVCAFLPVSGPMVALMFLAGVFAQMEWPSYDALVGGYFRPGRARARLQPELSGRQPGASCWRLFWAAFYLKTI